MRGTLRKLPWRSDRTLCAAAVVLYSEACQPTRAIIPDPPAAAAIQHHSIQEGAIMKSFSASTNIQAPADKIWSILTDGAG